MKVTNKAVMEALDGLPPVKVHCSLLAEEAIHAALWDYAQKNHIVIEGLSKPKSDIHEGEEGSRRKSIKGKKAGEQNRNSGMFHKGQNRRLLLQPYSAYIIK